MNIETAIISNMVAVFFDKKQMKKLILLSLVIVLIIGTKHSSYAQEHTNQTHHDTKGHHYNHIAFFAGATTQYNKGDHYLSLGLDYMRFFKKNERWGISFFVEGVDGDHFQWVFGTPVVFKLLPYLWLRTGPGIELVKEKQNDKVVIDAEFILRFGIGYDIHLSKFTISPSVDIDYIRYHPSLVWGINFGYGF